MTITVSRARLTPPELAGWLVALLGPALALALLRARPEWDPTFSNPVLHFIVVSLTSFLALGLAALLVEAVRQLREPRVLFLVLTFVAIAALFLTHALTTSGVLVGPNLWTGRSARLSLLAGAILLAASSWTGPERVRDAIAKRQGAIFAAVLVVCLGYLSMALALSPARSAGTSSQPAADHGTGIVNSLATATEPEWLSWAIASATLLLLVVAGLRYWPLYCRFRLRLQAGVLLSIIFLIHAQLSMVLAVSPRLSWWAYHIYILAAFLVFLFGLLREYGRDASFAGVMEGLLLRDTIAKLEQDHTEVIVALVEAIEAKVSHVLRTPPADVNLFTEETFIRAATPYASPSSLC